MSDEELHSFLDPFFQVTHDVGTIEAPLSVSKDYEIMYKGATLEQVTALKTASAFCMQVRHIHSFIRSFIIHVVVILGVAMVICLFGNLM